MEIFSIRKPIFFVQIFILLNVSPYLVHCLPDEPLPPLPQVLPLPPLPQVLLLPPLAGGPVALAFDKEGGGPYACVTDGRVIKYQGDELGFTDFCTIKYRIPSICNNVTDPIILKACGSPKDLEFYNKTGDLYITDPYRGLLVCGPTGGTAEPLVTSYEGTLLSGLNSLAINHHLGIIYFLEGTSGKLYKYVIETKQVDVLLIGLSGPMGLALNKDNSELLITENIACQIRRFYLKGEKANTSDVLTSLEGHPVKIRRTASGDFWVAIAKPKQQLTPTISAVVQKIDEKGKKLESINLTYLFVTGGISDVLPSVNASDKLLIGSPDKSFIYTLNVSATL